MTHLEVLNSTYENALSATAVNDYTTDLPEICLPLRIWIRRTGKA